MKFVLTVIGTPDKIITYFPGSFTAKRLSMEYDRSTGYITFSREEPDDKKNGAAVHARNRKHPQGAQTFRVIFARRKWTQNTFPIGGFKGEVEYLDGQCSLKVHEPVKQILKKETEPPDLKTNNCIPFPPPKNTFMVGLTFENDKEIKAIMTNAIRFIERFCAKNGYTMHVYGEGEDADRRLQLIKTDTIHS